MGVLCFPDTHQPFVPCDQNEQQLQLLGCIINSCHLCGYMEFGQGSQLQFSRAVSGHEDSRGGKADAGHTMISRQTRFILDFSVFFMLNVWGARVGLGCPNPWALFIYIWACYVISVEDLIYCHTHAELVSIKALCDNSVCKKYLLDVGLLIA